MKGKMNLFLAGLVLTVLGVFLMVEGAEAFCVYNKTDGQIEAVQISGGKFGRSFRQVIAPGDRECCSWKEKSCNKEGKKDSTVTFDVFYDHPGSQFLSQVCNKFPIRADGQMTVIGNDLNYKCE